MKKIYLLLGLVFAFQFGSAQMEDGSICPNFTGTDINGNSYTLYDLLDQGKSVVIDVSATWCGPCWNYHQTHALDSIWINYGPGGTDEMFVMWIEGDANTGMADLNGTTSASQGDWVSNTPYPIIDDASLATLLEIGYYPTIYMVCPNRIITEVGQANHTSLYASAGDCPAKTQGTDMSMLQYNGESVFCPGGDLIPQVTIQNNGTDAITSATIETYVNGTLANTDTWTGNMITYDVDVVTLSPVSGLAGSPNLTFDVNTTNDNVASNDEVMVPMTVSNLQSEQTIEIAIQPDQYPGETSWELLDGSGNVIDSRAAGQISGSAVVTVPVTLGANIDCFTFKIYDSYGDGICCAYGNGWYEVRDQSTGNVVFGGGSFTDEESNAFQNSAVVSVEDGIEGFIKVYPSISNGDLKVEVNGAVDAEYTMTVVNQMGQVVARRVLGANGTYDVDMHNYASGIYNVHVQGGDHSSVNKVILER